MPKLNYITIKESDFGSGLDSQSSENQIKPGFVEDLINSNPRSTGQLEKRKGYQGYAGYIPLRVKAVTQSALDIELEFDNNIQLPLNQSSPIIILGKTSNSSGDFGTETIKYYAQFTSDIRETFFTGANSLVVPETKHGQASSILLTSVSESNNDIDYSNSKIETELKINTLNNDITIDYVNNTGNSFSGFVYAKSKTVTAGSVYTEIKTVTSGIGFNYIIPASTHGLLTNNIIPTIYQITGTDYISIRPKDIRLDDSTGDITLFFDNNGGDFDILIILNTAPTANFSTKSLSANSTGSIIIPSSEPFIFSAIYAEQTIGGNVLELVEPDNILYDDINKETLITFTNNQNTFVNFEVYWEFAEVKTNKLIVSAVNSANFVDTEPQLTVYGFCHEELYGSDKSNREGWTNHIDSYRSSIENRVIAGLGGNLFASRLISETGNSDLYLLPELYPNINNRVDADTIIGPAFYDTGEFPNRTRGFITGDNGGSNNFEITDIAFVSGNSVLYTLNSPNLLVNGTLSTIIDTTPGREDKLTVEQTGYAVNNGSFEITAASVSGDNLLLTVTNTDITSADYNETDVGGLGGIFTDQVTFTSDSLFQADDKVNSESFLDTNLLTCLKSIGSDLILDNVLDISELSGGLRLTGERTSYVIPLRGFDNIESIVNLVRGDNLTYSEIGRELRILSINQLTDTSVTITGTGSEAVVTLPSPSLTMFVGKKLLIRDSVSYDGVITVTEVVDSLNFKFESTLTSLEGATIVGSTIEVDEQLTFKDNEKSLNYFQVASRWIPVESPSSTSDLPPSTRTSYFDSKNYTNQDIIRSTMVQDNLYLTNLEDEVLKFDGLNLYRAGIYNWQPGLFVSTDTTATGTIEIDNNLATYDSISISSFLFTTSPEDGLGFLVGDEIIDSNNTENYIIKSIDNTYDASSDGKLETVKVNVNKTITGAGAGSIQRVSNYLYYFRMNMIDINNNIIASAITGSEDFNIKLAQDAAVNIRLVGMPAFDIYDYDRLEVQVYRTKANQPAPYYKLTTLSVLFDNDNGYIDYTDTLSDDTLFDLDKVSTALKGAELGTAWSEPLRAKYCTSASNRLVLGNLKDYQTLDIQLFAKSTITQSILTKSENKFWLFRKDNTDGAAPTNMTDRVTYEFRDVSNSLSPAFQQVTAGISFTYVFAGTPFSGEDLEGRWVYLFQSGVADSNSLAFSGWWHIASNSSNSFTINFEGTPSAVPSQSPNLALFATDRNDIPVPVGTDGNYSMNNGNNDVNSDYKFIAMRRLANAINCSMRQTDNSLAAFSQFEPWMRANAGNELNSGQLVVKRPKVSTEFLEMTVPNTGTELDRDFNVFVNGKKRDNDEQVSAIARNYPSRIIASYPNYPEIFDNPTAVTDTESDSVIDINSSDGQEITAIIPFFGDAAFGSSQKSNVIVVFKTHSIYLVDLSAKAQNQSPVQKLETSGKGCTAPFSVTATKDGILFANNSNIYKLTRDLKIEFIGKKYERKYLEINKDNLNIMTGHNDILSNRYHLSYSTGTATENNEVAVYHHTREYTSENREGGWSTYNNFPATGWANLSSDSFFATTSGRVFKLRNLNDNTDYRDDDQAITSEFLLRANDMGDSGTRKVFGSIISHFRIDSNLTTTGTTLTASLDLQDNFQITDSFNLAPSDSADGLGDSGSYKIRSISAAFKQKVGNYIQLKYVNVNIDEPITLSSVDFKVAAKSKAGITEAKET